MSLAAASTPSQPQFARFSRRLKALFVDWTIMLAVIFGALIVVSLARDDAVSRVLGVAAVVVAILYEPVLVSRFGGTVGHTMLNLRIVDDGHGGNVSFPKAVARFAIKGVIGLYSFIVMTATRRNQAVHDLLTHSTVQARDAAKAVPDDFVAERTELASPDMPSRTRRLAAIAAYILLAGMATFALTMVLIEAGTVSDRCIDDDVCTRVEEGIMNITAMLFLAASACAGVFGWKGRLFGARRG